MARPEEYRVYIWISIAETAASSRRVFLLLCWIARMSSTRRIFVSNLTQSEMSEAKLLKTATVVCTIPKQLLVVVNIRQKGWIVAALLTSVRTSWKGPICIIFFQTVLIFKHLFPSENVPYFWSGGLLADWDLTRLVHGLFFSVVHQKNFLQRITVHILQIFVL